MVMAPDFRGPFFLPGVAIFQRQAGYLQRSPNTAPPTWIRTKFVELNVRGDKANVEFNCRRRDHSVEGIAMRPIQERGAKRDSVVHRPPSRAVVLREHVQRADIGRHRRPFAKAHFLSNFIQ